MDDVAFYGDKRVCYKYHIDHAEEQYDIRIKVAVFSGVITYGFHPRTMPESFEKTKHKGLF